MNNQGTLISVGRYFIRCLLTVFLLLQSVVPSWFLNSFGSTDTNSSSVPEAYAQKGGGGGGGPSSTTPPSIVIIKQLSGSLIPGETVDYIISYTNTGGATMYNITLSDVYDTGLIYSGVKSSTPNVNAPGVSFSHNTGSRTLTWSPLTLNANTTGTLVLSFVVSGGITSGALIQNTCSATGCDQICSAASISGTNSVVFAIEPVPTKPTNYDLYINEEVVCFPSWTPGCTTNHYDGSFVYVKYTFGNNGTDTADGVVFSINDQFPYKSFDSIASMGGGVAGNAYVANTGPTLIRQLLTFGDGFTLTNGQSDFVVVKYRVNTDVMSPILDNSRIGIPDNSAWYGGIIPLGAILYNTETNTSNNESSSQVTLRSFDLQISKSVLSNTDMGSFHRITYRLNVMNNSSFARDDIAVHDIISGPRFVSWSSPLSISEPPSITNGDIISYQQVTGDIRDSLNNSITNLMFKGITMSAWDSSYIDITMDYDKPFDCNPTIFTGSNKAQISITTESGAEQLNVPANAFVYIDNTLNSLPIINFDLDEDTNESNINNNKSTVSRNGSELQLTGCGGGGGGGSPVSAYDLILSGKTANTGFVKVGDVVTYTYNTYNSGVNNKYLRMSDTHSDKQSLVKVVLDPNRFFKTNGDQFSGVVNVVHDKMFDYNLSFKGPFINFYEINHLMGGDALPYIAPNCYSTYLNSLSEGPGLVASGAQYIFKNHYTARYDYYISQGYDIYSASTRAYSEALSSGYIYARTSIDSTFISTITSELNACLPSSFTNYCILKSPYGLTGSQCTNWSNQMTTDTIENSINPLHYINGMIGEPYYFGDGGVCEAAAGLCGGYRQSNDLTAFGIPSPPYRPFGGLSFLGSDVIKNNIRASYVRNYRGNSTIDGMPFVGMRTFYHSSNQGPFDGSEQLLKLLVSSGISYQDLASSIYGRINYQDGTIEPYYIDTNYYTTCNRGPFSFLSGNSENLPGACSPIGYTVNTTSIGGIPLGPKTYQNFGEFYNAINFSDCHLSFNGLMASANGTVGTGGDGSSQYYNTIYCSIGGGEYAPINGGGVFWPTIYYDGKFMKSYHGSLLNGTVNLLAYNKESDTHFDALRYSRVNTGEIFKYQMVITTGSSGDQICNTGIISMCNGITNDCNLGTNYITPETNINNNKKSMCVTVVDSLPIDLSVTSSFDTTTANLGDTVGEDITYCNNTPYTVTDIAVKINYANQLTYLNFTGFPSSTFTHDSLNQTLMWSNITLGSGQCATGKIYYKINYYGYIANTVEVGRYVGGLFHKYGESNLNNNNSYDVITVYPTYTPPPTSGVGDKIVDLSGSNLVAGGYVKYVLVWNNSNSFTGVLDIYDYFSGSQLTYSGAEYNGSPIIGTLSGSDIVIFTGIVVPPNSSASINVWFNIASTIQSFEPVENRADFIFTPTIACLCDFETAISTGTVTGSLMSDPALYDLRINKSLITGNLLINGTGLFRLNLLNTGNVFASGVVIKDFLPDGVTLISWTGALASGNILSKSGSNSTGILVWTGNMPAGSTGYIDLVVQFTTLGYKKNVATIDTGLTLEVEEYPMSGYNTGSLLTGVDPTLNGTGNRSATGTNNVDAVDLTITDPYDFFINKTLLTTGTIISGQNITYRITYYLSGASRTGSIVDRYDANHTYISSVPTHTASYPSSRELVRTMWMTGGVTGSIDVVFKIIGSSGTIFGNTGSVGLLTGSTGLIINPETNTGNNTGQATGILAQTPIYDLALTKVLTSSGFVESGDVVSFVITLFNQGNQPASNLTITDYIPAGLTLNDTNWTLSGSLATTVYAGPLAPGATGTVTINFIYNGSTTGTLINRSEISTDDGADIDSTPDQTNGTNTESTIDNEINNGSGDEDDHDWAEVQGNVTIYDLALRKTFTSGSTTPLVSGSLVTFTITLFNQGNTTANNIQLIDTIPAGLVLSDTDWTASGTNATTNFVGPLAPGATGSVDITLMVDGTLIGTATNHTEIYGDDGVDIDSTTDTNNTNDVLVDDEINNAGGDEDDHDIASIVIHRYDLALIKVLSGAQTTFYSGESVTRTITVFNQGTIDAMNVLVTDYLPAGLTLNDTNRTASGTTLTYNTPLAITAGSSQTLSITTTVNGSVTGTITNRAEIHADNGDDIDSTTDQTQANDVFSGDNNTGENGLAGGDEDDHDPAYITVGVLTYDLALRKTRVTNGVFVSGSLVTFAITLFNQGNTTANNIQLIDYIPAGLTLNDAGWSMSGSNATTIYTGPLAPGASGTLNITFKVNGTLIGTASNYAEIYGDDGSDIDSTTDTNNTNDVLVDDEINNAGNDEDDHDIASLIIDKYDLALIKVIQGGQTTFLEGEIITFEITVFNQGTIDANNVIVGDYMPSSGLLLIDPEWTDVPSVPNYIQYNNPLTIPAGDQQTITLQVKVDGTVTSGVLTNRAEIYDDDGFDSDSSPDKDNIDPFSGDNNTGGNGIDDEDDHDPAVLTIVPEAICNVRILKSATGTYLSGDTVTRTIEYGNNGNGVCNDITITDLGGTGNSIASGTILWTGSSLNPGQTGSFTITGTVYGNSGDQATNNVAITTTSTETTTSDNTDDAYVIITLTPIYDLALTKVLTSSGFVESGDVVSFIITLFNQGNQPASNLTITDYIPAGLTLNDINWTASGSLATRVYAGPLAPGATGTTTINFIYNGSTTGTITNRSEISTDDGADIDSTPDQTNGTTTESTIDNEINNASGDEDDHDWAEVQGNVTIYDLALRKTFTSGSTTPLVSGSLVTFTITLFNQGNTTANNIQLIDTIPAGLVLSDTDWTASGTNATTTFVGPLAPGATGSVDITLMVDGTLIGTATNHTEIYGDDGNDSDSTTDTNNTNDVLVDDEINNAGGDEDDHDIASIVIHRYDLALTKVLSGAQTTFYSGDNVTRTITVFNQGTIDAMNVLVTDYLPAGLTLNDTNRTASGSTLTYNTPLAIPAGSSQTLSITTTVNGSVTGTITNRAEIHADNGDDVDSTTDQTQANDVFSGDNNTSENGLAGGDEDDHDPAQITVDQIIYPDLFVTKTPDGGTYLSGDTVVRVINYGNNGPATVTGAYLDDQLPSGFTPNPSISFPYYLGFLAVGQTGQLLISGTVAGPSGTVLNNNVQIYYLSGGTTGTETNTGNNQDTGRVELVDPLSCNVRILKSATGTYLSGDTVTRTIEYGNNGNGVCNDIVITDLGGTGNSIASGTILWTGSSLNPGQTGSFTITGTVYGNSGDQATNNVAITTTSTETTTSDNTDDAYVIIALTPIYDLALTKVLTTSGFVESGDVVSFTITLTNQGNQPASNLTITDYIPAGLTLNDTNWTASGSLATRVYAGPLAPGATGTTTINFIYNGSTTGTITNRSEISTDDGADIDSTPDQTNGTNTESTIDNEINNGSGDEDDHDWAEVQGNVTIYDLALRKTFTSGSTTPLVSGSLVTFTITLFNQGNTTANNIQLIDTIPAGLVLSDTDWTASGTNATTNFVGPLAPGATGSVDITLMVDGTLIGTATNHTEIYGDDGSDIDSTTDTDNTNDVLVDDEINNTSGDEDDHDIASIVIHRYDLALIKVLSGAQTTFYSGDNVTRTITVFNQGTIDAMNVLVTDYLPAGLTLNDANRTASGSTLTYNTPLAITAGSSQTLSITTTVNGSVTGTITNRAEIHADNGDDIDSTTDQTQANDVFSGDNNTSENGLAGGDEDDHDPAQITVDQIIYPDLFVTKTPDGGTYLSGDTVVRVINYGNNGPATVTGAYLDDQLPSGFTPNPSISFPYYLGFLAVGQTGQLLISGTVAGPSGTVLNNNVQIYYLSGGTTGIETNTGNNQDTGRVELVDPLSCNVRILKSATGTYLSGDTVTRTIEYGNDGNGVCNDIVITDLGGTGNSIASGTILWTGSSLNPGQTGSFTITGTVYGNSGDQATNNVAITTTSTETTTSDNTDDAYVIITLTPIYDLALTKVLTTSGFVESGDVVSFIITLTNQGNQPASNLTITDYIPAGLTLNDTNWTLSGSLATRSFVGPLAPGATGTTTINFIYNGSTTGTLINRSEISTDDGADIDSTPDQTNGTNTESTIDNEINNGSGDEDDHDWAEVQGNVTIYDLALRKTFTSGSTTPLVSGSLVTFTITLFNQGNTTANNIQLIDTIPAGLVLSDTDWTASGTNATTSFVGPLAPGATGSVDITLMVDGTLIGTATNHTEIYGDDGSDIDSTTDTDNTNDVLVDDEINNTSGDEDDHDIASIVIHRYDLALIKVLSGAQTTFYSGDNVTRTITVFNQGTIDAMNVLVTDYLPAGLTLNDANRTASGSTLTYNTPLAITAGSSQTLSITTTVNGSVTGTITNRAEIHADNGDDIDSTTDQTQANDVFSGDNNTSENGLAGGDEDDHDPAQITVDQIIYPDLFVTKTPDGGTYLSGDTVVRVINYGNNGPATVTGAYLDDQLPSGFTPNPSISFPYYLGFLAVGQTGQLLISGTVAGPSGTVLNNNVQIYYLSGGTTGIETNTGNNQDTGRVELVDPLSCNVRILKSATGTYLSGATVTRTIEYGNDGNGVCNDIVITDLGGTGNSIASGTILWTGSSLNPGQTGSFTITGTVYGNSGDQATNNVAITTTSTETTTSDNTDDAYVIITLTPIYDLALTKVLTTSGFVESGDVVSFIITLTNQGNQPASNLTITDYIPAGLTLNDTNWTLSGSLATRSFVGPLAPGATGTTTINFIYNGSTTGTLINRSEISTDDGADIDSTPDQTNGTNTESTIDNEINNGSGDEDDHDWAEVQGNVTIYDLALRKTFTSGSTTPLVSGSLVTFTITLFNQGNTTANNIQLIDTIPAGLVLSDTDWTASGTNATTNFVGPLAPGATGSVDITLMVDGTLIGTATNHTEIYGDDGSDIDSITDTDNTNDVLVDDEINNTSGDEDDHDIASILIHRYDLALIKVLSGAQTTFYSGDNVTRTITVFNQGTIDAMNVLVTDYLPAGLTLNDANRTASGSTLTYNTPLAITAGSSQTLSITTTVNGSVTGTITNRAEIHADNGDDIDSTTDQTQANDVFSGDNNTGENGLAGGDEDDHDPAQITVDQIIYPDLFVTKTPDGGTYLSGDTVVRVINYGNNGPATVTGAYLDDQLPSGFTPNPSISFPYYLGFLAVGQTGQLLISGTVAGPSGTVLNNNVQIYYLSGGTTGTETNTGNNQDTGRVELVDPLSCNVRILKSATGTYLSGDTVTRTIEYGNNGNGVCNDIVITDLGGTGNSIASGTILWTGSSLNPGQTGSFTITGTVYGNSGDQATNNVAITTTSTETTTSDNTDDAYVIITLTPIYDLALTKVLTTSGFVESGDVVSFIITLFNQGNQPASNLTITDYIPAGLTLNDTNWTLSGSLATRSFVGPLAPGATGTVTINFIYNGSTTGTLINRSEISIDDGADIDSTPDQTNGTNTESTIDNEINNGSGDEDDHDWATVVGTDTTVCNVRILKSATGTYLSGATVTRTIEYGNNGNGVCNDIVITDLGGTGNSIASGTILWTGSSLNPGQTGSFTITGTVYGNSGDQATNNVAITTTSTETTTSDNTDDAYVIITLTPIYDLALTKVLTTSGFVESGDVVSFIITLFNQGNQPASNLTITDYIPAGLTLNDTNWTLSGSLATRSFVGPLAPGATGTVTINFIYNGSTTGTLINRSEISTDDGADIDSTPDQTNGTNIESTIDNEINNASGDEDDHDWATVVGTDMTVCNVRILKSATGTYLSGATVTRTIEYGNNGNGVCNDIVITDLGGTGNSIASGTILWTGSSLNPGQTGSFTITGTVYGNSGDQATNNVAITTTSTETTTSDNTDDAYVIITLTPIYDLALTKVLTTSGFVESGDVVSFIITLFNQGNQPASNLTITDYIPAGLTLNDTNWTASGSLATRSFVGPLAPGATGTVTINFIYNGSTTGTLINRSEISTDDGVDIDSTPDQTNGTNTESTIDNEINNGSGDEDDHDWATVVGTDTTVCNVRILKSAIGTYLSGATVTRTIEYGNNGNGVCNDIVITDLGGTGNSIASGTILWTGSSLNPGQTGSFTITGTVYGNSGDQATNNVAITTTSTETTTSDNTDSATVSITEIPVVIPLSQLNITITKSVNSPTSILGGVVVWRIGYANTSAATGIDVMIVDPLAPELNFVSASNGGVLSGSTVTWSLGTLNPGATGSVTLTTTLSTGSNGQIIPNFAYILGTGSLWNGTMVQGNGGTQDETTYTDNRSDSSVTISQPVSTVGGGGTYTYIPLPESVRVALEIAQPLKEEIIESYVPKYKILDTIRDIILETQESIEEHFVAPASLPNTGAE